MIFFHHLNELIKIMQLPRIKRSIVIYSEGANYWPHLEGIIKKILDTSSEHICYISSDYLDPGFSLQKENFSTFKTDDSFIRNWLFENIDCDILLMSMPDLGNYQIKRSRHPVHYIYIQHSLVSLHMIYRQGAFDHFDTIFCSGKHHVREMNLLIEKYNLTDKNLIEHGYGRLDDIIKLKKNEPNRLQNNTKHILIAPSWGENAIIEMIGETLIDILLEHDYKITLRPHPQTLIKSKKIIKKIKFKYKSLHRFTIEDNVFSTNSLFTSDIMISDWSGAALEYAFGLSKPVIFIDMPRKINNPNYTEIESEPFEVFIRKKIGYCLKVDELNRLDEVIKNLEYPSPTNSEDYIFNIGRSAAIGAKETLKILEHCRNE